jgi:hypothetical protein
MIQASDFPSIILLTALITAGSTVLTVLKGIIYLIGSIFFVRRRYTKWDEAGSAMMRNFPSIPYVVGYTWSFDTVEVDGTSQEYPSGVYLKNINGSFQIGVSSISSEKASIYEGDKSRNFEFNDICLTFYFLRFRHTYATDRIKEFIRDNSRRIIRVFGSTGYDRKWTVKQALPVISKESVGIDLGLKDWMLGIADNFKEEIVIGRKRKRGQVNRVTILVHGPPGTGKSRIAHMLASHMMANMYDISHFTSGDRTRGSLQFSNIPSGSIVILDDLDKLWESIELIKKRSYAEREAEDRGRIHDAIIKAEQDLNLLMSELDNHKTPDNVFTIITANSIEHFPDFMLRSRRVHHIIELGNICTEAMESLIRYWFPDIEGIVSERLAEFDRQYTGAQFVDMLERCLLKDKPTFQDVLDQLQLGTVGR